MWYSQIPPPHKKVRKTGENTVQGEQRVITDANRRYPQCWILGVNKGIRDGTAITMATFSQNSAVPLINKVVWFLMWEFAVPLWLSWSLHCFVLCGHTQFLWLMQKEHNCTMSRSLCAETLDWASSRAESESLVSLLWRVGVGYVFTPLTINSELELGFFRSVLVKEKGKAL